MPLCTGPLHADRTPGFGSPRPSGDLISSNTNWLAFPSGEGAVIHEGCGHLLCPPPCPSPRPGPSTHRARRCSLHTHPTDTERHVANDDHCWGKAGRDGPMGNSGCASTAPILKLKDVSDNVKWTFPCHTWSRLQRKEVPLAAAAGALTPAPVTGSLATYPPRPPSIG